VVRNRSNHRDPELPSSQIRGKLARSNGMAKRVWRVISWKTSVWRKRVWRTRSWRKRAWRSRGRREWRLRWHSEGVVSKRNRWNGPDFGHCRGHWTRRRTATSQQREGEPTWHVPQEDQQDSAKTWTWTWRGPFGVGKSQIAVKFYDSKNAALCYASLQPKCSKKESGSSWWSWSSRSQKISLTNIFRISSKKKIV